MSRDRSYRTPAIILRRRDFGEADRLLTILTPAHGKLDVIAKGARKPTSRKTGHVELFARADLLVHRGRELGIVVQADLQEPFLEVRENLQLGAYASYVVELLDRFTIAGDDDLGGLYTLLNTTLARLCAEPDPQLVVRYYEMRLLDLVGYRPELNECVLTHEAVKPEAQYFSVAEGGVVCAEAGAHVSKFLPLGLNALKLMRHMQRSDYRAVASLSVPPALHAEIERVMLAYLSFVLESRLQSADFIRRIRKRSAS